MKDSFRSRAELSVGDRTYRYARLAALEEQGLAIGRLPFALRILLENLLRNEDGLAVPEADVRALAGWDPKAEPSVEIAYTPARVLMQDFTGVPAVVDLAAMRDAMARMGGDPTKINPLQPAELVIDHSVQVDRFGGPDAFAANVAKEYERNRERYAFLRWGQGAFSNFKVVPPGTGIVHQINIEYLARVVMDMPGADGERWAYPDTLVGTDSHTTMVNGLGVLGWGVGGIEAEAAMLGQPVSMLIPQVIGVRLTGALAEGATATDLVLTVTEMLREYGVVGKLVEFCGPALEHLSLADRATIANMAPEYGATCGIFPVDAVTLDYLRKTGRSAEQVALVEAYCRAQGLFHEPGAPEATYTDVLELDIGTVVPSLAGPKRPQDRVALPDMKRAFDETLVGFGRPRSNGAKPQQVAAWEGEGGENPAVALAEPGLDAAEAQVSTDGEEFTLRDGSVVIAAITSCTNTSNPSVMLGAGLLARKAVEKGLKRHPWVKTSLAPGSKVVTEYLKAAGLQPALDELGFDLVGYGCTTCIGNSGPLPPAIATAVDEADLVVASVLSGNRNFEGRVHPQVRTNYLASPPLVVAFSLAGRADIDLTTEPLGTGKDGAPVFLKDVWPSAKEVQDLLDSLRFADMFSTTYASVFEGDEVWRGLETPEGDTYAWDDASTYVKHPPYFEGMPPEPSAVEDLAGARCLALFGDSVTTDHISPAGAIQSDSPAGRYLQEHGIGPADFNSYGSRRGNHEVMMRGTFANVRIKNRLVPGVEGGVTVHLPDGEQTSIYDAAMRYREEGVPLVVLGGKEYGTGSSRDWAAKGPRLLGVRAVIAESYERIHRSNLVGMGVLPLQFAEGESAEALGLTGRETFAIEGLAGRFARGEGHGGEVTVTATADDGEQSTFRARVRIDTPQEARYYQHGGILQYVLRRLVAAG